MMALEGATNTSTTTAFQFVDLPRLYIHTLPTPLRYLTRPSVCYERRNSQAPTAIDIDRLDARINTDRMRVW